MVGDLLALEHVGHEDVVDGGRLGPAGGGVLGRHHSERGLGLGGQELDLEPEGEAGGVAEQRGHVRRGVARDHAAHLPARGRPASPWPPPWPRCRGASACPPSRSAPPPRRRARGPRSSVGATAVTPSTRPPAVWNGPSGPWRRVPAWKTVDTLDGGDRLARGGRAPRWCRRCAGARGSPATPARRRRRRRRRRPAAPAAAESAVGHGEEQLGRVATPGAGAPPGPRGRRSARCTR